MNKLENIPPPSRVWTGLGRWLEATLDWRLANEGNILARPYQTDTVSCAVCTLNTITHNVFGDKLWQQSDASVHRLSWLVEFNKYKYLRTSIEPVSPFWFLFVMISTLI